MKRFAGMLTALLLGVVATPASALDQYRIAAPQYVGVETAVLNSAIERKSFEKAGIDLEIKSVPSMELITQRLDAGDFDAHVFATPIWQGNKSGLPCSMMIMPLAWSYHGAWVATVPEWKALKGGTAIMSAVGTVTTTAAEKILAMHDLPPSAYDAKHLNGALTLARMNAMLAVSGPAGTMVFDPHLAYARRISGMHVLADVGVLPVVGSGLAVKCSDKQDPKRWALDKRVVEVMMNEVKWMLDAKSSDVALVPWMDAVLVKGKYEELFKKTYGDKLGPPTESMGKAVVDGFRKVLKTTRPSKQEMDDSISLVLGPVPKDVDTYYDFSLMPK
ncbi:MAG TPA: hypothetical protein VHD38_00170 [Candidatus Paceibacterota bacterium]|nr:hypothetical protein [Candidatus Paceibacterota bacterium]